MGIANSDKFLNEYHQTLRGIQWEQVFIAGIVISIGAFVIINLLFLTSLNRGL